MQAMEGAHFVIANIVGLLIAAGSAATQFPYSPFPPKLGLSPFSPWQTPPYWNAAFWPVVVDCAPESFTDTAILRMLQIGSVAKWLSRRTLCYFCKVPTS